MGTFVAYKSICQLDNSWIVRSQENSAETVVADNTAFVNQTRLAEKAVASLTARSRCTRLPGLGA
jgi:hypothetical protein